MTKEKNNKCGTKAIATTFKDKASLTSFIGNTKG
jgi:hypothetical protein